MANRDIAGLLTGISSQSIDPLATLTPDQQRLQMGAQAAQRMGGGLRGLMGGGPTVQQQLATAVAQKQKTDEQKRLTQIERLAEALPPEYSSLATAVRNSIEGSIPKALEVLGRKKETTPTTKPDIVNLVDTKTNKTVGTAIEKDGQLFKMDGTTPINPKELEGFGISTSYVKPSRPLVSTVADPQEKLAAELRGKLFTPLETIAKSTAETAKTAIDEKRTAEMALAAVDANAVTGAVSAIGFDLAQIGQDVFQNLGIAVPEGWSNLTNSKAQYQTISAQALKPQIEKQGKGFTDKDREFFLKDVLPSYKQAWQFNELSGNLQREGAILKIAEAGFANNRKAWHVSNDKTPSQAHSVVWDDYLTKLPHNKLKKNAKKMVGGKEVTYDKYHTINDDGQLWQYWSYGKTPTGFTVLDADGNTVDYTFYELNNLEGFEGKTAREVLQLLDANNRLSGAIYK